MDKRYAPYYDGTGEAANIMNIMMKYGGGSVTMIDHEKDSIVEIIIDNAGKKNAFNGKMMFDLHNIIVSLEDSGEYGLCKGIIVHGANDLFCSGMDLGYAKHQNTPNAASGYEMSTLMSHILKQFQELPVVSVAYIHGIGAIGGGAELAVTCDFRLIHPTAKFGYIHAKMGIIPAWGGACKLVQLIGKQKALDVMLRPDMMSAEDCLSLGIADGIVDNFEGAFQWLCERVKHPPQVVRAVKRVVNNAGYYTEDTIDVENRIFAPLWGGPAHTAALKEKIKYNDGTKAKVEAKIREDVKPVASESEGDVKMKG